MILNRIEPGTECTVRSSGLRGKVNKIYFYPTKFEIEFPDGSIEHLSSKDLEFDGIKQEKASLQIPSVPKNKIGESWTDWYPFQSESLIKYHFLTTKEIMWKMLTSIEMYNVWFHGIQRALPILEEERYVHNYSFSKLKLKPGAYFKARPRTIAPWFKCRIMTYEENKEFGFYFKTNPLVTEYVNFSITETDLGVWVACSRKSSGLLSILDQIGWGRKSEIFKRLDTIIPKTKLAAMPESVVSPSDDKINSSTHEKKLSQGGTGLASLSKEEMVAYLANKGLDGDMDTVNNHDDKIVRAKAKAMIMKVNKGTVERPAMPNIKSDSQENENNDTHEETNDQKIDRLIAKGVQGEMDEINALTDKVLRGKIKAGIIKAKRTKK